MGLNFGSLMSGNDWALPFCGNEREGVGTGRQLPLCIANPTTRHDKNEMQSPRIIIIIHAIVSPPHPFSTKQLSYPDICKGFKGTETESGSTARGMQMHQTTWRMDRLTKKQWFLLLAHSLYELPVQPNFNPYAKLLTSFPPKS